MLEAIAGLDEATAREIGERARERMLAEHTYEKRAETADWLFRKMLAAKSMAMPS